MAVIGYARVSTGDPNPEAQAEELRAAGAGKVFVDHATGKTLERPELRAALAELQLGDTFMVCALERLGRSLPDLVQKLNWFERNGVGFRSLGEAWDTTTPSGQVLFQVSAAFAEFERAVVVDRSKISMEGLKRSGSKGGRPRLATPERARIARGLRNQGMTIAKIAAFLKVSEPTAVRCLDLSLELPEFSDLAREKKPA